MRKRKVVAIVLSVAMVFQFCLFSSQGAWAEQVMTEGDAVQSEEVYPGDSSDDIEAVEGAGETTPDVDVEETEETQPEETEEEPASNEQQEASPSESLDPAPVTEELTQDEKTDEEIHLDGATYYRIAQNEAVGLFGEATQNRQEAKEALMEDADLSNQEASEAAEEIFEEPPIAAPAGDDDEEETEEEIKSAADGTSIDSVTAKWLTGDTVNNGDDSLLYLRPGNNDSVTMRLQINYAMSGEHNYNPGDITITIPAKIFKDRNGKMLGTVSIPYPEDPSMKGDFNWKLVGDNYVLTNCKRMSAATKGYMQFQIDGISPSAVQDMQVSDPFIAKVEVVTYKGNVIENDSNPLTAQLDTEARLNSLTKRQSSATRVKASAIPEGQRIPGEEEYIKVDWYVTGSLTANTAYTISQTDKIPQDAVVESRKVVADEDLKDENSQIALSKAQAIASPRVLVNGKVETRETGDIQEGDTIVLKTEADVHGFILGGASSDTTSMTRNGLSQGYSTVYPASQFDPDVNYTFNNTVSCTVKETDPEVTEHTNPNVQEVDPPLVTTRSSNASTNWHYSLPKWIEPGGHYMVYKNGNDDTSRGNVTHRNTYNYSDRFVGTRYGSGLYGIYPSALNQLQDQYEDKREDGSVRLSYTIETVGYTLPWMYEEVIPGTPKAPEDQTSEDDIWEVPPTRIIGNYNRPVQMTTTDTGVSIGRGGDKLEIFKDYTFAEVEIPNNPTVYKGWPQNLNPDGTWTALTAGDGTFRYVSDSNKTHWPDITLQIQRGGTWEDWAVASWKSGSFNVTLHDGTTQTSSVIKVPEDTENVRTVVVTKNTEGGEGATEALQAGIDYDIRVVINLKSTKEMIDLIEAAFEKSNTPSMFVYNGTNMLIEREDEPKTSEERVIHSIDREGYDSIRGYTTDTSIYPSKSSKQTLADVNYEDRTITIHYSAAIEERSYINDRVSWQQAVDDGRLLAETHGTWYDLLPKGVTPDLSTIKLRKGDTLKDAYTVENYNKTGRTLLVVEADMTPTPVQYRSGDVYYYEDIPTIQFDAIYDFESLKDYGYTLHNVIAFESGNEAIGTIPGRSGEPDDPTLDNHNNAATESAFNNRDAGEKEAEKKAMKDLDPNRDDPSFVYAGVWTTIDILSAARTSLYKDVQVNNDGIWSDGTYYTQYYGAPKEATEGGRMRTVYEGGQYTYRLRVMSDPDTISTDMIMYDTLESFHAKVDPEDPLNSEHDYIDVGAPRWHGKFRGVDTSQLEAMGCEPKVYYSTYKDENGEGPALAEKDNPNDPIEDHLLKKSNNRDEDLSNDIWIRADRYKGSLDDVTAVAIDCTWASNDADDKHRTEDGKFKLPPMESIVALVKMQAPSGEEAREILSEENIGEWGNSAQAYNNAYMDCTSVDAEQTGTDQGDAQFIHKDYTKVGLKEYSLTAAKKWNDDSDRDGKRPDTITFRLYADGEPALDADGQPIVRVMNAAEGETSVSFEHVPYTTPDGEKIHYTIQEDPILEDGEEIYTTGYAINGSDYTFTNTHEPEKVSVTGTKTWEGDTASTRPVSINVNLYANGKLLKTQIVRPGADGSWNYAFNDLFRYENGEEIEYTVEEVKTPQTGDALDSYVMDQTAVEGGFDLTNTYHPFGDLSVSKTVTGTTAASENQLFTFTFTFSKMQAGEDGMPEAVPTLDEYEYEILDAEGKAVTGDDGQPLTGMISTTGTIQIKGGQQIHVKELPQGTIYEVTESEEEGFVQTAHTGDHGTIKPNVTTEAAFTNSYSANGQINLSAEKKLYNRKLQSYQFRFELYELTEGTDEETGEPVEEETLRSTASSGVPSTTTEREDGTVESSEATATFGVLRYTQADHGKTFRYRIKEVDTERDGYTYTKAEYDVDVTVIDNGDGTLTITPVYKTHKDAEGGEISEPETVDKALFENTYEADGNTTLRAWKSLPVRDLEDGEFTFELLDESGAPVTNEDGTAVTATNKADGTVVFDPEVVESLNYDETDIGKTYYYGIRETKGTDKTVIYDETVFGYAVTIVDNGDGTLYAEQVLVAPVYSEENPTEIESWTEEEATLPVFENELKDGSFSVQKTVIDSPDADPNQEFHFKIKLIGEKIEDGDITFDLEQTAPSPEGSDPGDNPGGLDDPGSTGGSGIIEPPVIEHSDVVVHNGNYRGMDWKITETGELILGREGVTQTYNNKTWSTGFTPSPWNEYREEVKSISLEGPVRAIGSLNYLFAHLPNLVRVDVSGFDTTGANQFWYVFGGDRSLEVLDLSDFFKPTVNRCPALVEGCTSLKSLDISGLRLTSNANLNSMFQGCKALERIVLGPGFRFNGQDHVELPTPPSTVSTGKWIKEDQSSNAYTPAQLASAYNAGLAGVWVWQELPVKYTLSFTTDEAAAGSMRPVRVMASEDYTLPTNRFVLPGYRFKQWVDNKGNTYSNMDVIPAKTYKGDEKVTLTAEFEPAETTVSMEGGEFEITLLDGEKATFDKIPAGTAYQVYEETPKGWVLVEQSGVSGTIEPLETKEASFVNRYEPGTTSVQFFGTKTLDYKAAAAGRFQFELKEGDTVIETVSTLDGGFIQFSPIVYKEPGTHVYTINEVDPQDDTLDWDTHTETITVEVKQDGEDSLVAETTYEDDGDTAVVFKNMTRPGNLRISKTAEGLTDANKDDEFTFKITLNNADGMPLGSDEAVYWYIENPQPSDSGDENADDQNGEASDDQPVAGPSSDADTQAVMNAAGDSEEAPLASPAAETETPVAQPASSTIVDIPEEAPTSSKTVGTNVTIDWYSTSKTVVIRRTNPDQPATVSGESLTSALATYKSNAKYVVAADSIKITGSATKMFREWRSVEKIDLNNFDMSSVTNLREMFYLMTNVTEIAVDQWDVRSVVNFCEVFGEMNKLKTLDISGWGANVAASSNPGFGFETFIRKMPALEYIDMSNLHISSTADVWAFFNGIPKLVAFTVGENFRFNTSGRNSGASGRNGFFYSDSGLANNYENSRWYRAGIDTPEQAITTNQLRTRILKDAAGTWVRVGYSANFTLQYDANGGTGEPEPVTASTTEPVTLPEAADIGIANGDMICAGWAKDKDAVVPDYKPGDSYIGVPGVTNTLYAVWMSKDSYLIHFNANGGFSSTQWKRANALDEEVELPTPTHPNNNFFLEWNTKQDGTGDSYTGTVTGEQLGAQPGDTIELYAQWISANQRPVKVEYYRQNVDNDEYSLYEAARSIENVGAVMNLDLKTYEGFTMQEHADTYTVTSDANQTVKIYYDRHTYQIKFDGNGADSGQMNTPQQMRYDKEEALLKNTYQKKGSIFKGWSLEPGEDQNVAYTDGAKVKNLTAEDGATVTLYAQWLSNEDHMLAPTNGEIIVKCKAGESIVIPDLPAGTTYTIEEINLPAGWSQKGEIEGNGGTIEANVTKDAAATNEYKATGQAEIAAHKILNGGSIDDYSFTFELVDDATGEVIDTRTQGMVDTYEQVDGEDDQMVDNPYYQTAIVQFDPITTYTQDDIGKDYTYTIREVDNVKGVAYDAHEYQATVHIEDAGKGQLATTVTYNYDSANASLQPTFVNEMKKSNLQISKTIVDATEEVEGTVFKFTVDLLDADGAPLEGEYEVARSGGDDTQGDTAAETITSGGTLELTGGETATIMGLPHDATYKVTEQERENWELSDSSNTEGSLEAGETAEASFTNTWHEPEKKPYDATGSVQLVANKRVEGGTIRLEDGYTFELTDENGEVIDSKPTDKYSRDADPDHDVAAEEVTESTITFDPIEYTLDMLDYPAGIEEQITAAFKEVFDAYQAEYDAAKAEYEEANPGSTYMDFDAYLRKQGTSLKKMMDEAEESVKADPANAREKTFTYTVKEAEGTDPNVEYDTNSYYYLVHVKDDGEGHLITETECWKPGKQKLDENGEPMVDEEGNPVYDDTQLDEITFVNKKSADLKVRKEDSRTRETLSGTIFTIEKTDGAADDAAAQYLQADGTLGEAPYFFVTGEKGTFEVEGVPAGTYVLTETFAPFGYGKAAPITFEVKEGMVLEDGQPVNVIVVHDNKEYGKLTIEKTLDRWESSEPVTAAFRITGVFKAEDGTETPAYENVVSITFDGAGTKSVTLEDIPKDAFITVTETYSGGSYIVKGDGVQTIEEQILPVSDNPEGYTVRFNNTYEDGKLSGNGATNLYEKDDNGRWSWKQLTEDAVEDAGGDSGGDDEGGGNAGGDSPGDTDQN